MGLKKIFSRFVPVGQRILSEIWIYPVKSLGGIRLSSSRVLEKGLEHDRRWMLIDEHNVFMTQRNHHKMALFKLGFDGPGFRITHLGDSLLLPFSQERMETPIKAQIWDDEVEVCEVRREYSAWFSQRLGLKCKLVSFPEENSRPVDPQYKINDEQVSLADAYPLLIIGQSSLDDLNNRLENPVPINRFRPNLVFTGGDPYEEDGWRNFKVGKNQFAGVKRCARCILTTVNQDTGLKEREPLLTLSRYRREGEKILFGQNVIAIDHYEIHEGDEIVF